MDSVLLSSMIPSSATATGHHLYHSSVAQANIDASIVELSSLDYTDAQTTGRIFYLSHLRAQVRYRSNWFRSYTYRLPMETLSLIFQKTCPIGFPYSLELCGDDCWESGVFDRRAVVLSCVSSYWRHVALNTPQLWTSVRLQVTQKTVLFNATLLQHHITHARNLCVSVALRFDPSMTIPMEETQRMRAALTNTLFCPANAYKIGALSLRGVPKDWFERLKQLPHLSALGIHGNGILQFGAKLEVHTPSLHTLSISSNDYDWSSVELPPTIRRLWLFGTTPGEFNLHQSLLQNCPHLIECRALDRKPHVWHFDLAPPRFFGIPIIMRYLESFTWDICDGISDGSALENLCLPALKTLHLISTVYSDEDQGGVVAFIHEHSGNLLHLELEGFDHWDNDRFNLLFRHDMPYLHTVRVTGVPLLSLLPCVRALTPGVGEWARERIPAPRLKELFLEEEPADEASDLMDDDDSDDSDLYRSLYRLTLEMLRGRRAGEHSEFRVEIPDTCDLEQDVKDGFRDLCLGGYRVTLMQTSNGWESTVPDWLLSSQ